MAFHLLIIEGVWKWGIPSRPSNSHFSGEQDGNTIGYLGIHHFQTIPSIWFYLIFNKTEQLSLPLLCSMNVFVRHNFEDCCVLGFICKFIFCDCQCWDMLRLFCIGGLGMVELRLSICLFSFLGIRCPGFSSCTYRRTGENLGIQDTAWWNQQIARAPPCSYHSSSNYSNVDWNGEQECDTCTATSMHELRLALVAFLGLLHCCKLIFIICSRVCKQDLLDASVCCSCNYLFPFPTKHPWFLSIDCEEKLARLLLKGR